MFAAWVRTNKLRGISGTQGASSGDSKETNKSIGQRGLVGGALNNRQSKHTDTRTTLIENWLLIEQQQEQHQEQQEPEL